VNIRKPTVDYTAAETHQIFNTNLFSAFELSRDFHPLLTAAATRSPTPSSIINIGSVAGVTCMKSGTLYAMTKAAMNQLTGK